MTDPAPFSPDAALGHTRGAADSVRAANHSAYHAADDTHDLYGRMGAVVELLGYLEQTLQMLDDGARRLPGLAEKRGGQLATDSLPGTGSPQKLVEDTHTSLTNARKHLADAYVSANNAWSRLSHLYIDGDQPDA